MTARLGLAACRIWLLVAGDGPRRDELSRTRIFCEGGGSWTATELIALATGEAAKIGLVAAPDVFDGCVVRQPKAYTVSDDRYRKRMVEIRSDIEANYPSLHLVSRNGMHKYNNQDHAMMTAMLTARNILPGQRLYDV